MAMTPERLNGLSVLRDRPRDRLRAGTKRHQDIGLLVALVVLLVWALAVAVGLV